MVSGNRATVAWMALALFMSGATGCPLLERHQGGGVDEYFASRGTFFESDPGCKDGVYCSPGIVSCVNRALWTTMRMRESQDIAGDIIDGFVPGAPCERSSGTSGNETDSPCDIYRSVFCAEFSLLKRPEHTVDLVVNESASIAKCMEFFGTVSGWWIDHCDASEGVDGSLGECRSFRESMDRLDECIQKRGPQDFPEGVCFLPFLAPWNVSGLEEIPSGYCEACPWWSSEACFESALQLYVDQIG